MYELVRAGLRDMPAEVRDVRSMLSYEERALLFGLAQDRFDGRGLIVDAGSFVGGSTLALACGLAARGGAPDGVIHSYDRLLLEGYSKDGYYADVEDLEVGSSLRPVFESNLASHRELVTLHEGDLLLERWDRGPIEILFVDIAKSWELNAHVVTQFFPSLMPGHGVVVQQDLVHWQYPWCAIVMESLADHFRYAGWTWYGSSVWECVTPLQPEDLERDWRGDVGLDQGLRLLRRSARRAGGRGAALLELARATLLLEFDRPAEALAEVERIKELYGSDVAYIEEAYRTIEHRADPALPGPEWT
ncbi:MAG: hypothetical protein J2P39_07620 [Candidatus Dormibacteraeota bacterium]|nr:hypothetical protein [Candidatus Dormibacteraeota bacterium]